MAEKEEFWSLLRSSRGDAIVLLSTFLLTIFVDLVTGIAVGVVLGALLFFHRMAEAIEGDVVHSTIEDIADSTVSTVPVMTLNGQLTAMSWFIVSAARSF